MVESNLLGQQVQGYTITKRLGSGGYGTVYLGEKEDLGKKYYTAIKHVSMPDPEGYEAVLEDYGYDKAATEAHFEKMVEGITSEINTLLELSKKDNRYIVAYYDHDIQKTYDPLRYEIFMRMEYLTPLNKHIRQKGITLGDIIKLGLNMCDALILCHSNGVMHRDIKEANIFLSESGNYKLGDFGIAKVAIQATQTGSLKGTASYMAPEIYLREPYDTTVDIYSLGIVLYKLLNNQRLPFMPDAPAQFTVDDKNMAEARRLKGETPPLPVNAKNKLGEIIVKACSSKADRYAKAEDLKADLEEYQNSLTLDERESVIITQSASSIDENTYTQNSLNKNTETQGMTMTMGVQSVSSTTTNDQNPYGKGKRKKKRGIVLPVIICVLLLIAGVAGFIAFKHFTDPVSQFQAAVLEGNYESAEQLWVEKIQNAGNAEKLEKVETFLVTHAEEVKNKYLNEEVKYENALTELQAMGKLNVISSNELEQTISEINAMRTSRAAYESAQDYITTTEWESAIRELRKVIKDDSNYSQAQTQLADAIRSYKTELINGLKKFDDEKDYSGAIVSLRAGLKVVPDDADILAKIDDYEQKIVIDAELQVDSIIQNAKKEATYEGYQNAISALKEIDRVHPEITSAKDGIYEVENIYTNAVFAEVDGLVNEKNFDAAVSLLEELKPQLSSNSTVLAKINEVNEMRPIDLSKLVVIDAHYYDYDSGTFSDSFGKTYDGRHYFNADENGYSVFNLEEKYSTFSGTIVSGKATTSDISMKLTILVDGTSKYILEDYTKVTGPVDFSIDVKGGTKLEIYSGSSRHYWDDKANICIVNAQLDRVP